MTLIPTDSVVGVVAKLAQQDPKAADQLARIALFEAFSDQLEVLRPDFEMRVHKNLAEDTARARAALLRSHVGKALNGEPEPEDTAYAEALTILDEYVEKSLSGWLLAQFNERVTRDERGRFARQPKRSIAQPKSFYEGDRKHGMQQSAVDLTSLTLGAGERDSQRLTRGIFDDDGKVKSGDQAAADWNAPTNGYDRKAYRRMHMTGQALAGASREGSAGYFVGNLTQLAGDLGPEAEKVLGPGIRRTAYRYRGTERRPDADLVSNVQAAHGYAVGLSGEPADKQQAIQAMQAAAVQTRSGADNPNANPAVTIANRWANARGLTPDQQVLLTQGDTAVATFLGVQGSGRRDSLLPDLDLVRLSLESGEMPPSQGVIIDADGRVATQALGYNGDHYLPFDLRNLGALQGGQYVRTRATGGPTTEDIYTGLLTGARQIQVVSNSGVFTVEFDPDFRGARRYNDKAQRMIERYGSLLEAIQNKTIYEPGRGLSAKDRSAIRQKAMDMGPSDSKEYERFVQDLTRQAELRAQARDKDPDELLADAQQAAEARLERETTEGRVRDLSPAQRRETLAAYTREERAKQEEGLVRRMKLDGVGYDNALRALQQEFPYYIRSVRSMPLNEWMDLYEFRNAGPDRYGRHAPRDMGYTEPGQTNTKDARKGPGFRSNRQVATHSARPAGGVKAQVDEEEKAPQGEQKREGQQQGGLNANGQRQRAQINLTDLAKPNGELARKADVPALNLINAAARVPVAYPAPDVDENEAMLAGPLSYLKWKTFQINNAAPRGMGGRHFFAWYATEATPQQANAIQQGFQMMLGEIGQQPDAYAGAGVPPVDQLQQHIDTLELLNSFVHPFAEVPQGQEPGEVEPAREDPKPPQIQGVPNITASPEEISQAQARAEVNNKMLEELNQRFAGQENKAIAEEVGKIVERVRQAREQAAASGQAVPGELVKFANDAQMAWAFQHAKRMSEELRKTVGDAVPFDKAARPRRRLIFG